MIHDILHYFNVEQTFQVLFLGLLAHNYDHVSQHFQVEISAPIMHQNALHL